MTYICLMVELWRGQLDCDFAKPLQVSNADYVA